MENIQEKTNQINSEIHTFSTSCERSEKLDGISKALSKAQAEMELAEKNANNPFFKSSYADLGSIIKAAKKPLSGNGLSISQVMQPNENLVVVTTILLHETGQFITSTIQMKPKATDPQGMGSAITYARRYAYAAIIGLSSEDDDGNAASSKSVDSKNVESKSTTPKKQVNKATVKQIQTIKLNVSKKGKSVEEILNGYKVGKLEELTIVQASNVITRLFAMPDKAKEERVEEEMTDQDIDDAVEAINN